MIPLHASSRHCDPALNVVRKVYMPNYVIIGGASGIATALAHQLKGTNCDLLLIRRNEAALAGLKIAMIDMLWGNILAGVTAWSTTRLALMLT